MNVFWLNQMVLQIHWFSGPKNYVEQFNLTCSLDAIECISEK